MAFLKLAERFQLLDYAYAHRGFWAGDGPPENSIEAFKAAANAGLGVELDVRPASDGTPICFHDPLLDRMTDASGLVCETSLEDLKSCNLPNGEPIPSFTDVLAMWPHNLPILVEMKIDGLTNSVEFAARAASLVERFPGKAAMMSFSEDAVEAVPSNIMRGQLIAPRSMIGAKSFEEKLLATQTRDIDYLALHVSDATAGSDRQIPTACWTVTQLSERQTLQSLRIAEIFEHLPPPLAAR